MVFENYGKNCIYFSRHIMKRNLKLVVKIEIMLEKGFTFVTVNSKMLR